MIISKNQIINLMGLVVLLRFFYFYPSELVGWLMLGGSFYYLNKMNLDNKIKNTLLFILFIHQLFAVYYFLKYPGYVEGIDFTAFHLSAKTIAENNLFSFGTDAALFSKILGLFYKINNSQLFGQEISVLFFLISCFIFIRIIKYYKLNKYLVSMLLFYGLLPSSLLWTSVILREPFEVAFLMLAFECLLYFKSTRISVLKRLIYLSCSALLISCMCLLHKGLFLSLPIFFIIALLPLKDSNADDDLIALVPIGTKKIITYVFFILLPIFFLLAINFNMHTPIQSDKVIYNNNNVLFTLINGLINKFSALGIPETLYQYRYGDSPSQLESLRAATTNYDKGGYIPGTFMQFLYECAREYFLYAFLPAVLVTGNWTFLNIIISILYILRFLFFCSAINFSLMQNRHKVNSPITLLVLFFIVSFVFSLGTLTYGTAMRHNIMTDWILILLGTPFLHNYCSNLLNKNLWIRSQSKPIY